MRETRLGKDTRLRTPEWVLGVVTLFPASIQHPITSLSPSALLEVFPMGSETSPEGRFCTLPASGAVNQPLEGDSRGAEAWKDERDPGLLSYCDFRNGLFIFHPEAVEYQMLC